jgi:hypothetical protein
VSLGRPPIGAACGAQGGDFRCASRSQRDATAPRIPNHRAGQDHTQAGLLLKRMTAASASNPECNVPHVPRSLREAARISPAAACHAPRNRFLLSRSLSQSSPPAIYRAAAAVAALAAPLAPVRLAKSLQFREKAATMSG